MQDNELEEYDSYFFNEKTNQIIHFPTKMIQSDCDKFGKSILNNQALIDSIPFNFNKTLEGITKWLIGTEYGVPREDRFVKWFKEKRNIRPTIQVNGSLEQIESILIELPQFREVTEYDLIEFCKDYKADLDNTLKEINSTSVGLSVEKKEFKLIKNATPKESKIINAFIIETEKPRMTQATALNNLEKSTDLGIGGNVPKNRKKQIHDILKSFGLALKEK